MEDDEYKLICDRRFNDSNYTVNDQDFHYNVVNEFERQGWRIESVYLGNPMHHDGKYVLINNAFVGKQRLLLFFNRSNTARMAPTPSIPSTSAARNSRSTTLSHSPRRAYRNYL